MARPGAKKGVAVLSRAEGRGPPGRSPLLVIAGLPVATASPAAATIVNDRGVRWHAISVPFGRDDGAIYPDHRAVLELGRLVCEFAREAVPDPTGVPSPSRIALAYVPCDGSERLWDVFGHAVWPIRLAHPDWKGRGHWRHDIGTVNRLLGSATASAESEAVEGIRLRLEARRSDDPLLLPARNFHLDTERRLFDPFRDFMKGTLNIEEVGTDVRAERFAFNRLPHYYTRMGGAGKRFAFDDRRLVFAKSNHGQHGGRPMIERGAVVTPALLQRVLEARYRFGTPLEPEGFQHDVQREGDAVLNKERFDCVIRGERRLSGSHVNVFPSDVVTGGTEPRLHLGGRS
jgi:hypothetical protein